MKFKYFIRGLGAGILFTTIIMMIYYNTSGYKKMTNEDIQKAALNLGMVYNEDKDVDLSGLDANSSKTQTDTSNGANTNDQNVNNTGEVADSTDTDTNNTTKANDNKNSNGNNTTSNSSNTSSDTKTSDEKKNSSSVDSKDDTTTNSETAKNSDKENQDSDSFTVVIKPGMYSSGVAELLVKEGIIDNEQAMIDYLASRKWQLDIRAGEYKIPKQTTLKEIAEILTNHTKD